MKKFALGGPRVGWKNGFTTDVKVLDMDPPGRLVVGNVQKSSDKLMPNDDPCMLEKGGGGMVN